MRGYLVFLVQTAERGDFTVRMLCTETDAAAQALPGYMAGWKQSMSARICYAVGSLAIKIDGGALRT